MIKGFRDFVLRGNVVDLAVAVVMGAAFGAVVTQFVDSFITPLIGVFGSISDFSDNSFAINGSRFAYGAFVNVALQFLLAAAVIFVVVVRPLNLLLARVKVEESPVTEAPSEQIALLTEIRDVLRGQGRR